MDKQRQGEIALKLIELKMMKSPMPAPNDFMRELGNVAKDIGEDVETMREFYEAMLPKMIGRMLKCSSVSLKTSS